MRKYETDYAGMWRGFCNTRESAVVAATRRIVYDGYSRCTITDRETGEAVARLVLSIDKKAVHVYTVTQIRKGVKGKR